MRCNWCQQRPVVGPATLCDDCQKIVRLKSPGYAEHVMFDTHVDNCEMCHSPHTLCDKGSQMRAQALAADGSIAKEYAEVFGGIDPDEWFMEEASV